MRTQWAVTLIWDYAKVLFSTQEIVISMHNQPTSTTPQLTQEEKDNLRWERNFKVISVMITLLPFAWGIVTYGLGFKSQAESAKLQAQSAAIEAKRPFLDLQLKRYTEAVQLTSYLATHQEQRNSGEYLKKEERFREIYWGELSLVENGGIKAQNGGVEGAMVRFKDCLSDSDCSEVNEDSESPNLENFSLDLAHACRDSLAQSWNIQDWQTPQYEAQETATPVALNPTPINRAK